MRLFTLIILAQLFIVAAFCQQNRAVRLDGEDNFLPFGMGQLSGEWTLEAWIKGDGNPWNDLEVVIGAGYYAQLNTSDHIALAIKDGKLHNNGANISSPESLPVDEWLHVAAICDSKSTSLYINGEMVATRDTSIVIIPGVVGAIETKESLFGGDIDEVRIWSSALSEDELSRWMGESITPSHPHFNSLIGYYTFDSLESDIVINRVGKSNLPYHLRNDRIDYYGNKPHAKIVDCDNSRFKEYQGKQRLFNATVIASEWDSDQGESEEQILKIRVIVDGEDDPLSFDRMTLDLSGCDDLADIDQLNLYYTGSVPRSDTREAVSASVKKLKRDMTIKLNRDVRLRSGVNYFLLSANISADANIGDRIKITVPSITLSSQKIEPVSDNQTLDKFVSVSSKQDDSILKVIQWNIWHGGVHVGGVKGRDRIIDLIRDSNSDVVMMQEAYGAQQQIAKALNFQMISASDKDNLALYSRYPIEKLPTEEPFFSNPAYMTLPSGRQIFLSNTWIRYAYEPEYTSMYGSSGFDPEVWCKEDSQRGLVDLKRTMKEDVNPYIKPGMDIIYAGDFNSGSHLDWTERAAHLHNGYYADLPISRHMYDFGYIDTFRSLHPDEVERGEGTYAPVFAHIQHSRIDYIYYKGDGIEPIFSKIVRTPYEIDDVWAGDHAAVMTTFRVINR